LQSITPFVVADSVGVQSCPSGTLSNMDNKLTYDLHHAAVTRHRIS
jgi:hypothetical protein